VTKDKIQKDFGVYMIERLNSDFIEKIILKGMLADKDFLILCSSVFEAEYFDDPNVSHVFKFCRDYANEYSRIPDKDSIINSSEVPDDIKDIIDQAEQTDFNVADSYEFLLNQANDYLKEKAIKQAIIESVDDVEDPERRNIIQQRIENALIKDIKVDLGLKYFEDMGVRLRRIFTATESRIPTYFPLFDELINGGFPPYTFNVLTAKIHGGKCVDGKTNITVKNNITGDIENTRFKDFFLRFSMIKKYGEKDGKKRYNEWKKKISKSSKNRNTLDFFIKKYGEKDGKKRHELYIEKQKCSMDCNKLIEKVNKDDFYGVYK